MGDDTQFKIESQKNREELETTLEINDLSSTWKLEAPSDYLVLCGLNEQSLKWPGTVAKTFTEWIRVFTCYIISISLIPESVPRIFSTSALLYFTLVQMDHLEVNVFPELAVDILRVLVLRLLLFFCVTLQTYEIVGKICHSNIYIFVVYLRKNILYKKEYEEEQG